MITIEELRKSVDPSMLEKEIDQALVIQFGICPSGPFSILVSALPSWHLASWEQLEPKYATNWNIGKSVKQGMICDLKFAVKEDTQASGVYYPSDK